MALRIFPPIFLALAILLAGCALENPEPLKKPVVKAPEAQPPALLEALQGVKASCQFPLGLFSAENSFLGMPASMPYGNNEVFAEGKVAINFSGTKVNATVISAGNQTFLAFNLTLSDNSTYGFILNSSNQTILFHDPNVSAVDILSANVTRVANLTGVSQGGSGGCGPFSTAPIIEFYNRTFPGISGNLSIGQLALNLSGAMNTSDQNGTTLKELLLGLAKYLNLSNFSSNFSIKIIANKSEINVSKFGGKEIVIDPHGVNTTITNDGANYSGVSGEFIEKDEMVLIAVEIEGVGRHQFALDDLATSPNSNGKYHISLMDPATGIIYVGEMSPDGSFIYRGRIARIIYILSLSPTSSG